MGQLKAVIMAGGIGKRLWPLSEALYPKPFIKLTGSYSLLQNTLFRNKELGKPIVIVSKEHRFIARDQIKEIGIEATLVLEPEGKSTAPCGLVAAMLAEQEGAEQVVLLPADHHITCNDNYLAAIKRAQGYTENSIGAIGIPPDSAHAGYGYIKIGKKLSNNTYEVMDFVEKPGAEAAEKMVTLESYYWNAGIFIYSSKYLLEEARQLQPDCLGYVQDSLALAKTGKDYIELNGESYSKIIPISFDKAFMEKVRNRVMVEGDFGWHDIGSWDTLWKISRKDNNHNFADNNVILTEVSNSYIKTDTKLTAVIGLDNVVVINSDKGLLVANKNMLEKLKGLNIYCNRDRLNKLYAAEESTNFDHERT